MLYLIFSYIRFSLISDYTLSVVKIEWCLTCLSVRTSLAARPSASSICDFRWLTHLRPLAMLTRGNCAEANSHPQSVLYVLGTDTRTHTLVTWSRPRQRYAMCSCSCTFQPAASIVCFCCHIDSPAAQKKTRRHLPARTQTATTLIIETRSHNTTYAGCLRIMKMVHLNPAKRQIKL